MVSTTVVEPAGGSGRVDVAIRLLGEVGATVGGHAVPVLATPRMTRLVARLSLARGTWVPRDQLARELWPDSDTAQARTNLRKLLHNLRRSMPGWPDVVDVAGSLVRWGDSSAVRVDVLAFRDALAREDPADAVRSYGGDLLPGCDDDWVVAARERLRRLAVEALAGLAASAQAAARDSEIVEHARRLLGIDPLHEPACRSLMQALARRGERGEALRTYQRLTVRLGSDLGVAPEPATTALADLLRHTVPHEGAASVLVGRSAEWNSIYETWRAAAGGRARVLCVAGEAGIGKSRLVEELTRQVSADGHAVAYSRAYEAAGRPPWGSVIDLLRAGHVRARLDTLDPACLTELARLLPELRMAHTDLPDAPPATDPGRRHHLLAAVRRGLLAAGEPLLLVVDDLQWCDTDTVELCEILVHSAPSAPVLIAATVRDEEAAGAQLLDRWRRHLAPAVIALGPLDRAATVEMAALLGRQALTPEAVTRLWTETEGNPLFIAEAIRAGFGGGAGPVTLTPTVHALITARLDRLPPSARDLAEVAATIGREFTPPVLAMAARRTEDDIADDLDELWRLHVVRDRGPAYDFSHDRLRDVVLQSISPARRRKLHRCVAEAIELQHADDLGPVSARLAGHFVAAGLGRRALVAYERAAQHAYRLFALDACIALLQRALTLLHESAAGEPRDEVELRLLSAIGVPLVARRGYGVPEVQRCYERALTLHRRLGRPPSSSVLRGLALHAVVTCRFDRAREMGRKLIEAGRADRTARVEGEYVLGVTHFWRGEFAASERHLATAVDRYRIEDAPLHVARYAQDPLGVCLSRLALTQLFLGRRLDADRTMREAVRVATELDNPMTVGYVRAFDAVLAALEPEGHDLDATVTAADTVTSARRIDYFAVMAELLSGWRDARAGDLRGLATMRRATERIRREQPLALTLGLSLLARGHQLFDQPAAGRAGIAGALDWTERCGQCYLLPELLRIDAELLAACGDRRGGAHVAQRAVDTAVALDSPWLRDRALATLTAIRPFVIGNDPGTPPRHRVAGPTEGEGS